jgi:peptidoglycan L-alanyl-D-glutamate endopeptidase CwlK
MRGKRCYLCLGLLGIALCSFSLASEGRSQSGRGSRLPRDVQDNPRLYGPGDIYARIPARDEFGRDQLAMFRAWNPNPLANHEAKLRALQPALARVVRKAQADNPGLHFVIGSGRRDRKLQRRAVAWGWSMTSASSHRSGRAVDLWPLDQDKRVIFDAAVQNRIAAALEQAANELGVSILWGGHFHGYKHMDRSHFELASP